MKLWNSEWEGVVQYQRQQRRIADKLKKGKKKENYKLFAGSHRIQD